METLHGVVDEVARRSRFSGVVRVDRAGSTLLEAAYGEADRAHRIATTVDTRFGIASVTKGFTALVVMRLVETGVLRLETTARSLLGSDLPLVADDVTVEHLLAHRSGIGDYLDETAMDGVQGYVLTRAPHELTTTESYLPLLDGHPTVFAADSRFAYNNAGYVLLALMAERASGTAFDHLVRTLVCAPAGMTRTSFLRTDELPGDVARGYLKVDGMRTNVLHLPVLGSGDGGLVSTVADLAAFWTALVAGQIVSSGTLAAMVTPVSDWPEEQERYGLGFHLAETGDAVWLEGYDAGVSCTTLHRASADLTYTVIANWSEGSWPVVRALTDHLGD